MTAMIDTSRSTLHTLSVHRLGPGGTPNALDISSGPLTIENDLICQLLLTYFLGNFSVPEYYSFDPEGLKDQDVYASATKIFDDTTDLHAQSVRIAQCLRTVSTHPSIKAGDLYVAYFSGVVVDDRSLNAVGIFKSEIKETYLKLTGSSDSYRLTSDEGINVRKLDKAALILDEQPEQGYKVLMLDNAGKSDAAFWRDDFLRLRPWSDDFHHTRNFLNLTRQYIGDQLEEDFSVSKADKIDMLNRSINFFKTRDQFDQREFEAEVLADPSVIESFRNYGHLYMSENDIADNFEISTQAVQRQARVYKSVLKLDKNFHVYIHGNRDMIEKGFDTSRNRHFYKLYFDQEA
jgi:hypothetical protein